MHDHDLTDWTHGHRFDEGNRAGERGTRLVLWITLATMAVEICAGWWFNSMALLADGWHMSSHALALGLAAFAYAMARRHADDARFAFGTWKIEVLAGFASAILLLGVALAMVVGSVERLLQPQSIAYREALAVAVLGLLVNLLCAWILGDAHSHDHHHDRDHHDHDHAHSHPHGEHRDLNLHSAYLHVLADAATSLLAIVALAGAWRFGWNWLDPLMGLIGALLVARWSRGLLQQTAAVLLDREMDHPIVASIRQRIEGDTTRPVTHVTDLHVWRVGTRAYACALSLLTHDAELTPARVRERLAVHGELVHLTIEITRCPLPHEAT
jgi:cation diffusion facilitator family transporter